MPLRALILSPNEVCYNPRLMKAGDYLSERGVEVTVFNPITGIASEAVYDAFKSGRPWRFQEFDISKRSRAATVRWAGVSLVHKLTRTLRERGGAGWNFPFVLNKGLMGYDPDPTGYDLILINLVDTLPLAARLKRRYGAVLIYDAQEFFTGQVRDESEMAWVREAEARCIGDVDIAVGTTDALVKRLRELYDLQIPMLRVRNAPYMESKSGLREPLEGKPLQLVWHGFQVNYEGRGVNLILDALAKCSSNAELTLQGRLSPEQRQIIEAAVARLGLEGRVMFKPPAHPEAIVESIRGFDVGISAEPGVDENQALTSSNKLFEYLHGGLSVIVPDLPGLTETILEYDVGLVYPPSDVDALAACIDTLAADLPLRQAFQGNAQSAATAVTWEKDYAAVYDAVLAHPAIADLYETEEAG